MPQATKHDFSVKVKLEAVSLMKTKRFKTKEIMQMFNIPDRQTVHRWVKEFDEKGTNAFHDKVIVSSKEIKALKKQNDDLRIENEILKKAIAYFTELNNKG